MLSLNEKLLEKIKGDEQGPFLYNLTLAIREILTSWNGCSYRISDRMIGSKLTEAFQMLAAL